VIVRAAHSAHSFLRVPATLRVVGVAPALGSLVKILDGLYKVAVGIDELRNRYGRDHGREQPLRGLGPRHAHFAVHSATAYCRFLLDTLADPRAPWHSGGIGT
jgi:hypothetical protein